MVSGVVCRGNDLGVLSRALLPGRRGCVAVGDLRRYVRTVGGLQVHNTPTVNVFTNCSLTLFGKNSVGTTGTTLSTTEPATIGLS